MELMIVVSLIGEQWSPKTAPLRTAARLDSLMARPAVASMPLASPVRAHAIGPAMGITIAMAENELPVANAITADTINVNVGINLGEG